MTEVKLRSRREAEVPWSAVVLFVAIDAISTCYPDA